MSGSSGAQATQPPAIGSLQVQTSTAGMAIPLVWGRNRIAGNLLWYGDFKQIPHEDNSQSGGKGGGSSGNKTVNYTYQAAVLMGLCGTQINGIPSAWRGKERIVGSSVTGKISTLTYEAVVSLIDGTITVPSAANFYATVQVYDPLGSWAGFDG